MVLHKDFKQQIQHINTLSTFRYSRCGYRADADILANWPSYLEKEQKGKERNNYDKLII